MPLRNITSGRYGSFSEPVLSQDMTVCPGAHYELTFTVDRQQIREPVFLIVTAQGQQLLQTVVYGQGTQGYGPYPFSVPASADTFAYTTLQFRLESLGRFDGYSVAIDNVSVYQP
ncbi:hypothetical protein PG996_011200 [Apiospora saccharicola]|uniref:Uncharacterized protein n=1 Tax=Apiospora saccharicola TaxID=335842 RepID=A0ABR1UEE0_9PEZI